MLRDPIAQIASVRRLQARYPNAWCYGNFSGETPVSHLARVYLRSLSIPLESAPLGQLKLVQFESLLNDPEAVIEEVSGFLGLEPNIYMAMESAPDFGQYCNDSYEQQWRDQVAKLSRQLFMANLGRAIALRRCLGSGVIPVNPI